MRWREIPCSKSPVRQSSNSDTGEKFKLWDNLCYIWECKIVLCPPISTAVYMNDSLRGFVLHKGLFLSSEKMGSSWNCMFFYVTWPLSTHTSLFLFYITILSELQLPHPSTGIVTQPWCMSYSLSLRRKRNKQFPNKTLVLWWLAASVRKAEQSLQ